MPHILTKSVTAFKFNELSEKAKDKVLERFYNINVDDNYWYEGVIEDSKTIGKIIGIDITNIFFSGFSSQGDGACFEGEYRYKKGCLKAIMDYAPKDEKLHSIVENLCKLQSQYFYKLGAKVKHKGHYSHAFCTDISLLEMDKDGYYEETGRIIGAMSEYLRDFMQWIYKQLNEQYDYMTSKEAIIETIESNDYDFTEEGGFPAI